MEIVVQSQRALYEKEAMNARNHRRCAESSPASNECKLLPNSKTYCASKGVLILFLPAKMKRCAPERVSFFIAWEAMQKALSSSVAKQRQGGYAPVYCRKRGDFRLMSRGRARERADALARKTAFFAAFPPEKTPLYPLGKEGRRAGSAGIVWRPISSPLFGNAKFMAACKNEGPHIGKTASGMHDKRGVIPAAFL